jgi:hypothetical protein
LGEASGNDEDAPIPAIRRTAIEPPESTLSGHSARRMKSMFWRYWSVVVSI